MSGRPAMIRNLRVSVPCRILAWVAPAGELGRWFAWDGVALPEGIYLSGRIAGLKVSMYSKVSLYGHKSRRGKFFIEEIEKR